MKSKAEQRVLGAECRNILEKRHIFDMVIDEINKELYSNNINEETLFLTAKEAMRREGIKEGMKLLLNKINKYATQDE